MLGRDIPVGGVHSILNGNVFNTKFVLSLAECRLSQDNSFVHLPERLRIQMASRTWNRYCLRRFSTFVEVAFVAAKTNIVHSEFH